jgi:hypothetical protein
MAEDRTNMWKMTSIGIAIAAVVAVVTGVVVANRTGSDSKVATAPSALPSAAVDPKVAQAPAPVTQVPAAQPATPDPNPTAPPAKKGTPPQSVVAECNRVAGMQRGPEQTGQDKWGNILKGGGVGALGGAAAGALGGAIADGGKGAGKGALIGGGVGAGAGSLYGIYKNKQHDEAYRSAYMGCMRGKGYTA